MPSLKPGFEIEPESPVSKTYQPPESVIHFVADGEDWRSVAKRYRLDVARLIDSNFKTNVPEEINWYLREYIRCVLPTNDRKNWRFSTQARFGRGPRAGVVFVELNWKTIIDEAKKATRILVRDWFEAAEMGPELTRTIGEIVSILPGAVRVGLGKNSAPFLFFKNALRDGGTPHNLAEAWGDELYEGLIRFTNWINENRAVSLMGFNPPIAGPWPMLASSNQDGVFSLAQANLFMRKTNVGGVAATRGMAEYVNWFKQSFFIFCQQTLAKDVTFIVFGNPGTPGNSLPQGMAIGRRGFLRGSMLF